MLEQLKWGYCSRWHRDSRSHQKNEGHRFHRCGRGRFGASCTTPCDSRRCRIETVSMCFAPRCPGPCGQLSRRKQTAMCRSQRSLWASGNVSLARYLFRVPRREATFWVNDSHLPHALVAFLPQLVLPLAVLAPVAGDVLRQGVQRPVGTV